MADFMLLAPGQGHPRAQERVLSHVVGQNPVLTVWVEYILTDGAPHKIISYFQ